ncbi:MAG: phosphoenolpyruvate carboxylase, partial [Bacteriovoracaceae bacterium]
MGESIRKQFGPETYQLVERTRKNMKSIRAADHKTAARMLEKVQKEYAGAESQKLKDVAHSFSLMLELINRCESAYRYFRLQGKEHKDFEQKPYATIFVFTAHPTEARSPEILQIYQEIYKLLIQALNKGQKLVEDKLRFYLNLSLNVSMARSAKPTVEDEAHYLYSYILRDEIVTQQIQFAKKGITVNFRSWVGGDKDGHPGVNEKTMIMSLNLSRNKLVGWIRLRLLKLSKDLSYLNGREKDIERIQELLKLLPSLRKVKDGDGERVVEFKNKLKSLGPSLAKTKMSFPDFEDISTLLWLYPAIVLPLEVREDAELVHEALKNEKLTIYKMLEKLKSISLGYKAKWYVRGFILSMSESAEDVDAGLKLAKKTLGSYAIPVAPLFETAFALENATAILAKYFEKNPSV